MAIVILPLAGCEWFDDEGDAPIYESIRVELRGTEIDTFADTREVRFGLRYLDCISEFYGAHPEARIDGGEEAPTIIGDADDPGWARRLCEDPELGTTVDCEVLLLYQELESSTPTLVIELSVEGDLDMQQFALGPLPDAEIAECSEGRRAEVQAAADFAQGMNADGAMLWSSREDTSKTGIVGQGGPMVVFASPVGSK